MIVTRLHHVRRVARGEFGKVETGRFERPTRSTVAARHLAPHVLVKVDEDVQSMRGGAAANLGEIVEIFFVV